MLLPTLMTLAVFPAPFTRQLHFPSDPPLRGRDVTVLQQLLRRIPGKCALACGCGCSHTYDEATSNAIACYTNSSSGVFDEALAHKVLAELSSDGWTDDGTPANASGHLYKISIPVHRNRSIETTATLFDEHNGELLRFRVRAHGIDADASGMPISGRRWPDLRDDGCPDGAAAQGCVGLNAFSSDGNTPTGLSEIDLNSPEDVPRLYGPWPVNRFVRGISGNAQFLLSPGGCAGTSSESETPPLRSGILLHTGAWANHSSWTPGQPMPNSDGCVHAYPDAIKDIWQKLVAIGVKVRPNSAGRLPYPHVPQGLVAVYEVGSEDAVTLEEEKAPEGENALEGGEIRSEQAPGQEEANGGDEIGELSTGVAMAASRLGVLASISRQRRPLKAAMVPTAGLYSCQPINHSRVSNFCDGLPLPASTCVDAAGFHYRRDRKGYEKQKSECTSPRAAKDVCPNKPTLCDAQIMDRSTWCGQFDQACSTDADCEAICYSDCFPCNDAADCDTLVAFGVVASRGDTQCFSVYNHSDEALAVAEPPSNPSATQLPSHSTTRPWVYGNHTDHTAFEVCALGSLGCLHGPVEPIDVVAENSPAESRLLQLPSESRRHILIIPGRTPNSTPRPYRMNDDEHTRVSRAAAFLNESGAALIFTSGGNVHPNLTPFNEAFQMKLTLVREFGVPADRVVIDPYARHSTTNLRNAGRFMLAYNVTSATIVTDMAQTFLFSHPDLSLFNHQCRKTLGYVVGKLHPAGHLTHTSFVPSSAVWARDETEPRDP